VNFARELADYSSSLITAARRRPLEAFLLAALLGVLVYFYGFLALYGKNPLPIWTWAWGRFLPKYNQEHSKLVPLLVLFLVWYHRADLRAAPKSSSNAGLVFVFIGLVCYIVAARALQARLALFGLPFLVFGVVLFLWGRNVARILLFPVALLFFLIPLGAIEQTSFRLQFLIVGVVKFLSGICGIGIENVGTSLHSSSGKWAFDIAEGCSGIRSLIAMIMLTALYVHFSQPILWKKLAVLSASVLFAVIGNAGRIFTIIVIAQLGLPRFAGGVYHDWSSQLIFFPIALLSMLAFGRLLTIGDAARRDEAAPAAVETPAV
jgi:exosortase